MLEPAIHERLRQARLARGEDLIAIAARTGVRPAFLEALEEGRYADLPRGIYGRATVKTYAAALGLDADEMLRACDGCLPEVEDPIAGIARVHGYTIAPRAVDEPPDPVSAAPSHDRRTVRLIAASAIDTAIVLATLLGIVWITIAAFGIPMAALGPGARPAFALMGAVLAGCYFGVFGGIGGQTPGARAASLEPPPWRAHRVDLGAAVDRAVRIATHELLFVDLSRRTDAEPLAGAGHRRR